MKETFLEGFNFCNFFLWEVYPTTLKKLCSIKLLNYKITRTVLNYKITKLQKIFSKK